MFIYNETKDDKYGFINLPSELIDISIAKNDYKSNELSYNKVKKYTGIDKQNNEVTFYSYNNFGFLSDLLNIIIRETNYKPWIDVKYKKRLYRTLIFLLFTLLSDFSFDKGETRRSFVGNIFNCLINEKKKFDQVFNPKLILNKLKILLMNLEQLLK